MGGNGKRRPLEDLDLLGTYEAHLILGVERSRIARWLTENEQGKAKIPEPVGRLKSGPVWRREQIEAKLAQLGAEAGHEPGTPEFDAWAVRRSLARAAQMKPPMPADELERIIRRPVPAAA